MPATSVTTLSDFDSVVAKNKAVAAYFWADWAPPCKDVDAVFQVLADEHASQVTFLTIEAEEAAEISEAQDISSVPTVILFLNGDKHAVVAGANAAVLTQKVQEIARLSGLPATAAPAAAAAAPAATESLEDRLKRLTNQAPVMLFMKGNPAEPKCGFSRKMVAALVEAGVKFDSFDIITDNDVRQGLKEFSNWPTFPQLYIKGSLVGGLDVVNELIENDELMVPKSALVQEEEPLNDRLKRLTNQAAVMLFMKGDPSEPKCGFSRKMVAALNEAGVKFDSFDILTDDDVRQGLKEFSNWPTFPQLYIKGSLVGGLDVVNELIENDELMVPKSALVQ